MLGPSLLAAPTLPNGVASGDVDQTSAVLWARSTAVGPIVFEYSTQPDFSSVLKVDSTVEDPAVAVKVEIALNEGTAYYYRVTDAAGGVAEGRFRTPSTEGYHGLRFGVSGDWRGDLRPYPSLSNVVAGDLDFFAVLGDTIYADIPSIDVPVPQARTLDELRIKHNEGYLEAFGINTWAEIRAATSLLACIDDHEMTNDFAGGAPPSSDLRFDDQGDFINETELYRNGLQAFQEYNPLRNEFYGDTGDPRTSGKAKLYRYRTYGRDAAVFMVDARSFRDDSPPLLMGPPGPIEFQAYLQHAYDSSRTMLGEAQFDLLRADLVEADEAGVTWKFILIPEPIQNLGPILGGDRFEAYAYERSRLLNFIHQNGMDNVVFIAADIHGTIVNNLEFRRSPNGPPISTTAFEVTTGSVAFEKPLGAATIEFAPPIMQGIFDGLNQFERDTFALTVINGLLWTYGYPSIGLQGSPIDVRLLAGRYLAVNTFGWTKFDIDAHSQCLTVTTYGIDWYDREELFADPDRIIARRPKLMSRFRVEPRYQQSFPGRADPPWSDGPGCNSSPRLCGACGALGSGGLSMFYLSLAAVMPVRRRRSSRVSRDA